MLALNLLQDEDAGTAAPAENTEKTDEAAEGVAETPEETV